ncbi:Tex family protein [Fundicoccus sp. Sow4_H7]|uniref:Tex family protein n=1 Tax=Fundicoccus sp. Sow4_H7 TaxID=3438784 RepID=UPI003F901D14
MEVTTDSNAIIKQISQEVKISQPQIQVVLDLLNDGKTIPFIARYRKELTGSLDEVQIHDIQQRYNYVEQLNERKEEVHRLIDEQGKLTEELVEQINIAATLQQIEDIYRPYKQKRRTKAMIAIENGLQPLADWILDPDDNAETLEKKAALFINEEVVGVEEALAGAHEILAQDVSERAEYREFMRKFFRYNAELVTSEKDASLDPQGVYQMYYDYQEQIQKVREYQVLAINRAEKEDVISVKIEVNPVGAQNYMEKRHIPEGLSEAKADFVRTAIEDAYKRFIKPAIEREIRNELNEKADKQAISVFSENLRNLLLQPPLKGYVILGFDPAYRTGCKLAIIDATGRVLDKAIIYPHNGEGARQRAKAELKELIQSFAIEVIAIGNGTASRESEQFVSEVVSEIDREVRFIVVSEAGASVYSASKIAREEFPDFQVEERSAVSIARRLQDPLAELIKIDPKSMGVGQYQHDVAQNMLNNELDFVINMTVNQVGVDINTASVPLLQHVSGLTAATAENIVAMRNENGSFTNRKQIKSVKRLGPKTYEQAVGFLRILNGENPLDQTSIHPESYPTAMAVLDQLNLDVEEIGSDEAIVKLNQLDRVAFIAQHAIGEETLNDIIEGLKNPLHDIRDQQDAPILRSDVLTIDDLEVGMQLQGVVRNVVDFGAFVDIGVKEDGLIHISKLSKQFIKHPSEAVAVGDIVDIEVLSVDKKAQRIGLKRVFTKK